MMALEVRIQSKEDQDAGKPLFKDVEGIDDIEITTDFKCAIFEKGTVGGQTSLGFILKGRDGKYVVGQVTANQMEMLIGAYKGAVQRFGNNESDNG